MRTLTKALAAAALTVASMSSFAATVNWTGTLTGIKVQYWPTNDPAIPGGIQVVGPSSTTFLSVSGTPCLGNSLRLISNSPVEVQAFNEALQAAKAVSGASVTISYDNSNTSCQVKSWTRN